MEAIKIFCKLEDKKGKAIIIFGKLEDKNVEAIAIFCKKRREKSGDHHDLLQLKGYNAGNTSFLQIKARKLEAIVIFCKLKDNKKWRPPLSFANIKNRTLQISISISIYLTNIKNNTNIKSL